MPYQMTNLPQLTAHR